LLQDKLTMTSAIKKLSRIVNLTKNWQFSDLVHCCSHGLN